MVIPLMMRYSEIIAKLTINRAIGTNEDEASRGRQKQNCEVMHAESGPESKPQRPSLADDFHASDHERENERIPFGEGPFQMRVLFCTVVAGSITLMAAEAFYLSTRVMDHWCEPPHVFAKLSMETWKQLAIPRYPNGSYSRCTVREPADGSTPDVETPCKTWQFNLSQFGHNVISEWSLVCHRAHLMYITKAINHAATVIGLPLVGAAADNVGRKIVTVVALTALLLALIVSSLARDFQTFVVTASVVAASSKSLSVLFVLLYEVTTASRRLFYCTIAPTLPTVLTPVFHHLVDAFKISWSLSYQLVAALGFVLLATFWFIEESPDWLLATQNPQEAERVVLKVASVNSVSPWECRASFRKGLQRVSLELLAERLPLRPLHTRSSLLMAFSWLVVSWGYSYDAEERAVTASVYVRFTAFIAVVPLFLVVQPFLKGGEGVKHVIATSLLVLSVCSALLFTTFSDQVTLLEALLLVVMRLLVSLCLILIFFLTVILYPTTFRCTAVATGMAIGVFTDKAGQAFFRYVIAQRDDIALGGTAVLTALAAVATEYLPSKGIATHAAVRKASSGTALSRSGLT